MDLCFTDHTLAPSLHFQEKKKRCFPYAGAKSTNQNGKSRVKHCLFLHVLKSLVLLFLRNVPWDWHKMFSIRFWTFTTCRSYSSPFTFHSTLLVLTDCPWKITPITEWCSMMVVLCRPVSASTHNPLDSAMQLCVIPESLPPCLLFFCLSPWAFTREKALDQPPASLTPLCCVRHCKPAC